jgi:hypothetical protein
MCYALLRYLKGSAQDAASAVGLLYAGELDWSRAICGKCVKL